MILQLDLSSTIPFYVQIRNQIVLWITSGRGGPAHGPAAGGGFGRKHHDRQQGLPPFKNRGISGGRPAPGSQGEAAGAHPGILPQAGG